jgi:hypothetical protein
MAKRVFLAETAILLRARAMHCAFSPNIGIGTDNMSAIEPPVNGGAISGHRGGVKSGQLRGSD